MKNTAFCLSFFLLSFVNLLAQNSILSIVEAEKKASSIYLVYELDMLESTVEKMELILEWQLGEEEVIIRPSKESLVGQIHFLPSGRYELQWFPAWENRKLLETGTYRVVLQAITAGQIMGEAEQLIGLPAEELEETIAPIEIEELIPVEETLAKEEETVTAAESEVELGILQEPMPELIQEERKRVEIEEFDPESLEEEKAKQKQKAQEKQERLARKAEKQRNEVEKSQRVPAVEDEGASKRNSASQENRQHKGFFNRLSDWWQGGKFTKEAEEEKVSSNNKKEKNLEEKTKNSTTLQGRISEKFP